MDWHLRKKGYVLPKTLTMETSSREFFLKLPISELRTRCQTNAPEAGRDPLLGHTIRFFSIYFTKYVFLPLRLTPNQITVISVLVFFFGLGMYLFNDIRVQILGSFLIWFSVVLDGCDGEMARLKGNPSKAGSIYTEPVSHDIMYAVLFVPISVNLWLGGFPEWILLVGWLAATTKLLQRLLLVRFDKVRKQQQSAQATDTEGDPALDFNPNVSLPHKFYRFVNRNFFSSVGLVLPLTFAAVLQHLEWFLYSFAIFFCTTTALHFISQVRYITALSRENIHNEK